MEFKVNIIQTVIHGKIYRQGQEFNIKDINFNILNILHLKRAICVFKKIEKVWLRSNIFEYKIYLEKLEKKVVKKSGRPKKEVK